MQAEFWNQRYAEPEPAYGTEPNAFVASQRARFRDGGSVVCLGEGEGRNAVWLAKQGLKTTAIDYAHNALERTRAHARAHQVEVATLLADLSTFALPEQGFDGVVAVFLHLPAPVRRDLHRRAFLALRPSGVFVAEFFSQDQLAFDSGGPRNPALLYTVEDLRDDFAIPGAQAVMIEQQEVELHEGRYHQGRASVIRVVVTRTA